MTGSSPEPEAPSGHGSEVSARWGPQLSCVREAQRFVARSLAAWQLDALAEPAGTVLSELVTNAVVHARSAFTVTLQRLPDGVLLRVNDDAPPVAPPEPGQGERGLARVSALTAGWGAVPDGRGGKAVWALLADATSRRP